MDDVKYLDGKDLSDIGISLVSVDAGLPGLTLDTKGNRETNYTIEINADAKGLERIKNAISEIRTPDEQTKYEINTMREVLKCEGKSVTEKADNFLSEKDARHKELKKSARKYNRYKIIHR